MFALQRFIAVLGKQSLFVVRITGETLICCVADSKNFGMLKQVVHVEPLDIEG
jgi:uncharacterized membrane protein YcgQ (UPF0703/DUF1980 family)